ncbi:hypothetical protein OSTOST_20024 [Ostertagia ostertagi]
MVINILIIVCYTIFLCFIRKIKIRTKVVCDNSADNSSFVLGSDKMKTLYRSLIVISLTVVFGWFSTTLIGTIAQVFHLNIARVEVDLAAGVFVNTACAINFFIYYAVR